MIFDRINVGSSERTRNIARNVIYIFGIKGVSIVLSFLIIPVTIDYVNKSIYGIWLTMFSIVSWLSLFDIGLGNGLRNKLSAALANHDNKSAEEYVSTTYFVMAGISALLFIITVALSYLLDWKAILKLPDDYGFDISHTLALLSFFFCLRFIVQLISVIYYAIQKAYMVEMIGMIGNLLSFVTVYFGRNFFLIDRLLFLVYALCLPPVVVMIVLSIRLFHSKKYRFMRPRISKVRREKMSTLTGLGLKFFILQLCVLVNYSMTNFLILRFLTASDVTYYNLAYKYFSALLVICNIICAPLWSAFTEAYTLDDFKWINNCIRKLTRIFFIICFVGVAMLAVSPLFYRIWLNNQISIPFSLSAMMLMFILACCLNSIVIAFVNGVEKIKLQTILVVISAIIYIPACNLLAVNLHMGVTGFVAYMFVTNLIISTFASIQTYKILHHTAHGIWDE